MNEMPEMIKIEIKIGDEFRVQDVCYRCEESMIASCSDCAFQNNDCCCNMFLCGYVHRTDGKDVKFKIVE